MPINEGIVMKKQRLFLCALLLSFSSWVSASVPIIKLPESQSAVIDFYSPVSLSNTYFEIKNNSKLVDKNAGNGMHDLQSVPVSTLAFGSLHGILKPVGSMSTLTDHQVIEGSFSSYVRGAASSNGTAISDASSGNIEPHTDEMVASRPALKIWAVLLLAIGCVIYLGSRRQRPFGYRKLH
ncbi:MAG: hypothetical protein ACOH2K_06290 [Burkholderiaceae bacterium]